MVTLEPAPLPVTPPLSPQPSTLASSRSEKGSSWSSRSLGARCRNSIASCPDEQPHIGNYRLLKTIGKGNFAKVKLARHILTGREVSRVEAWRPLGSRGCVCVMDCWGGGGSRPSQYS